MSRPRAVLLDALGTLVGLEPPWERFAKLMASRHGIELKPQRAVAVLRAEMAYYRENCHTARDAATLAELRARCARLVADELAIDDDLQATLLDSLRFAAYPDVLPALERLRDGGARLAVVSNWDVSLHDVLAETQIAPLLDAIITSAEAGCAKPDPAIFAIALERIGVAASEAVHVGDSFEEDVAGARAAGIEPILIRRAPGELIAPGAESANTDIPAIASLDEVGDG